MKTHKNKNGLFYYNFAACADYILNSYSLLVYYIFGCKSSKSKFKPDYYYKFLIISYYVKLRYISFKYFILFAISD